MSEKLRYRSALEVNGPVPEHAIKAYESAIDQMLAHRDEADALRKELDGLKDGLTTSYMVGYESGRDSLLQVVRHLCDVYILDDYYTGDDRAVMLNRVVEKQIDLVREMDRAKAEGASDD